MVDVLERLKAALADRYTIERELGHGGMATVYLARDLKLDRPVALKVLRPELGASLGAERFVREIEIAAKLTHPNILSLHDCGEADGLFYYVMPYVEGETLRDRLKREKQLSIEDVLQIAREVADALGYAHSVGVIHRDIKPENILFGAGHAMVADFGIARAVSEAGGKTLTETGLAVGTPAYMSPEQAGGERELDGRTDIYSLACVLFEALAGQPPFTGPSVSSLVSQHLAAEPPVVSHVRPGVPDEIVYALQEALSKTPADRPATAGQFLEELVGDRPSRLSGQAPVRKAKRPWGVWAVVAGAVVIGALLATVFLRREATPEASPTGEREWVIVAEFGGSAAPSHLKMGRSLVGTVLDQSRVVTTLPSDQVRRGLELTSRPATTTLTVDVARELAIRGSIGAVVTGQIDRAGSTYSVLLRVMDPNDGAILAAANGLAGGDDRLIPVTDSLARALRAGLGEQASQIRADRPLVEVMTPSLEAYRKFVQALELNAADNWTAARQLAQEALELDPDFAAAYRLIGYTFYNVGQSDSADAAFEEARSRPDRLTDQERLGLEALTAFVIDGDAEGALGTYEQLLTVNPNIPLAHTGLGNVLFMLGRWEEALDEFRTAAELSPFGASQLILGNIFGTLLNLRRVTEADSVWRMLEGVTRRDGEIELALAHQGWARAEALAQARYEDPATPGYEALPVGLWLSSALAARGAVTVADSVLDVSHDRALSAGFPDDAGMLLRARWLLALASGSAVGQVSDLSWIEAEEVNPGFAQAASHAISGEWSRVVELLAQRAASGQRTGIPGTLAERWLVATAYQRLGHPDSAAFYYELVVDPPRIDWLDRFRHGITFTFGHQRLAAVYEAEGQDDLARRHRRIVADLWAAADEELRRR